MARPPPLNALRAFEAAARHLSMKQAADELAVTPGAISQLVRGLEQQLGTVLFRRGNRSLTLTEAGQGYFVPIRHAFRQINEATRRLQATPHAGMLTVSAPPAFAASWLVPRLGRFRTRHADIELNIATTRSLANFGTDGVDLAIRHGLGSYPGLRCDRIATIAMVPVCSPRFLASLAKRRPRRPADLLGLSLLHDADRQDWALWFQAQGVADLGHTASNGISFDDQTLLIRAADVASGHCAGDGNTGAAGTRSWQPGARAGCRLAAGVFLLAGVSARHRRSAQDRGVSRLAAGGRPRHHRERASSQASSAGPKALRLL